MPAEFDYSNAVVRPPGPVLRALSRLPAVGRVQAQVGPYAAAWETANRRALDGEGPLWVALGDSLSQGVGASAYDRGWVGQLADRLRPDRPHGLVNLSVYGARIQDVRTTQVAAMARLSDRSGAAPALVTCLVGSNDLISGRRTLVWGYRALLDALPPGTVVGNLPNPTRAARELDELLREAAADGRIRLADLLRGGPHSWRGRLASDWFHPNDAGYAALADVFEGPVRSVTATFDVDNPD